MNDFAYRHRSSLGWLAFALACIFVSIIGHSRPHSGWVPGFIGAVGFGSLISAYFATLWEHVDA